MMASPEYSLFYLERFQERSVFDVLVAWALTGSMSKYKYEYLGTG